jgi:ABC-type transport system substrate-binding protein
MVLVGFGLALAACSPNPYPGETGKVMHAALRLLPKNLDPPRIEEEGSGKIGAQVYEGLLIYHPFARPYKLVGALAEGLPEISDDRLTYTFKLRKGIHFVDDPCFPEGKGREVTAQDFEWCFKRFSHPRTKSTGWWGFSKKITGLEAWRDARKADVKKMFDAGKRVDPLVGIEQPVEGFSAPSRYTFVVRLLRPYPQLLWFLAMPYTSVYPHEAVKHYGQEFRNHPVGTGPFRVKEFDPVYRVVLERNKTYREHYVPDPANKPEDRIPGWNWEEDQKNGFLANAGKRMPILDGMEIRFITEDQPRWLYFKAGYSDFIFPPKDHVADVVIDGELTPELKARGARLEPWPELGTVYTSINCTDPLLANVDLRRAMALAYDHSWTVEHLYGGAAVVATSLIPPGVAGFDGDYHPHHRKDGKAQLKKAREFMKKAGYPDGIDPKTGKPLHIVFQNSGAGPTQKMFYERLRHEMGELGIELSDVPNTFAQMTEKMSKGSFQMAGLAWGFDYPDAQNILQLLYGGNIPQPNRSRFKNPEFDELYQKAIVMEDGPERTTLYQRMAHIVGDQAPWITRTHRVRNVAKHGWLLGLKYTETSYHCWRYADVDVEKRMRQVAEWNQSKRWPLFLVGLLLAVFVGGTVMMGRRA